MLTLLALHVAVGAGLVGGVFFAFSSFWRLTFEFSDGRAYVLDYEDYH